MKRKGIKTFPKLYRLSSVSPSSASSWWLRSANNNNNANYVNTNGNNTNNNTNNSYALALGYSLARQSKPDRLKSVRSREGELDLSDYGLTNISADGKQRTLLAWCGLMVILHFMLVPY